MNSSTPDLADVLCAINGSQLRRIKMGTCNLTCVVVDKKFVVAQYCQWDGYPSGQGQIAVDFLTKGFNKKKFLAQVKKSKIITQEEIDKKFKPLGADPNSDWITLDVSEKIIKEYPHLHRNFGAQILAYIQNTPEPEISSADPSFAADSLFCEWAYVLDLDNDVLEVYKGFNKRPLGKTQRFYFLRDKATEEYPDEGNEENKYYPVRLLKKFPLKTLRSEWKKFITAREKRSQI
jgi:hypothetical protein